MEYNYIKDLSIDKQKLLKKYSLSLNDDLIWEFNHKKYYKVKYFTHKFALKHSTLSLLFHIYKLCYAKIKYFEDNLEKYEPFNHRAVAARTVLRPQDNRPRPRWWLPSAQPARSSSIPCHRSSWWCKAS